MPLSQAYLRVALFILFSVLLTLVTHHDSEHIIKTMLPLYEWMLKQLEYRFDQSSIQLVSVHGERVLQVNTILSQPFWVTDANGVSQQIAPTETMLNTAGLAIDNILQPLVIIGTIVMAWPVSLAKDEDDSETPPTSETQLKSSHMDIKTVLVYVYRLLLAIPLIILIMLVDMPVKLIHSSWLGMAAGLQLGASIHVTNIAWLGYWSDFLNGGGLIALSIAAGLLVVGLCQFILIALAKDF